MIIIYGPLTDIALSIDSINDACMLSRARKSDSSRPAGRSVHLRFLWLRFNLDGQCEELTTQVDVNAHGRNQFLPEIEASR